MRTFCGNCGTSISYRDQRLRDELYVTIGFHDHPERLAPQVHAFWPRKLPWIELCDDLPRIERHSRPRS